VDTVGVFTQDVAGTRLAAEILCRSWDRYASVGKPVLGVPEGAYLEQASAAGLEGFARQVRCLEEAGYLVKRLRVLDDIDAINQRHRLLIAGEAARVHADWFAQYGERCRPRTVEIIRKGQQIGERELEAARAGRLALRRALAQAMRAGGIDIWICPSAPGPAPKGIDSTGDPIMNLPWTHAGLPVLSLPVGRARNGMPLGLQCVTCFMQDERLLKWGERLVRELTCH
jgi:Asp-tRNA(Asn)/Glu-tRNA(Gln) amidotransferase A subunit family amidase